MVLAGCTYGDNATGFPPEDEVEGEFTGPITRDCRCFGDDMHYSISCATGDADQRVVVDAMFYQSTANVRSMPMLLVDIDGYRGIAVGTGYYGGLPIADPRSGHDEHYRALGFDTLDAPAQPLYLRDENDVSLDSYEYPGFQLRGARWWCKVRP